MIIIPNNNKDGQPAVEVYDQLDHGARGIAFQLAHNQLVSTPHTLINAFSVIVFWRDGRITGDAPHYYTVDSDLWESLEVTK